MPNSFSRQIVYEKQTLLVVVVPELRQDGMYYEVNIKGYPRFYMTWSALGRFDVAGSDISAIPYGLALEVSDLLEKQKR